ncbi:hypothetical protein ACFLQU_00655 [Verrucomicrobiota bacterium]
MTVQAILVAAALAVTSISCVTSPPPAPKGTDMVLVLSNALRERESVFVYMHIRDRAAKKAFSLAPDFNPMPHDTLCDALMVAEKEIMGPILVKFTPDAWVPGTNDTDSMEYMLELKLIGNTVTGRYECIRNKYKHKGDVLGSMLPSHSLAESKTLSLHMENARPERDASLTDTNAWHRRGLAELVLARGKQRGRAVLSNSHRTYGWSAIMKSFRIIPTPPALTATMTAKFDSGAYNYTFTGLHIADKMAGRFKVRRGGKDICEGAFIGTLDTGKPPPPEPQPVLGPDGLPLDGHHPPPHRPPPRRGAR